MGTGDDQDSRVSEHTILVFESRTRRACQEMALVLQALDIDATIVAVHDYQLFVGPADADRARAELDAYLVETSRPSPPPGPPVPRHSSGVAGVIAYVVVLLVFAYWQSHRSFGVDWLGDGRLDAGLVVSGEWWRSVTALTLHLDLPHLAANLVFGAVFGLFAAQMLGTGLAWFSILFGGALGNILNAWLQPASHRAIGASTAIFAALGLLAAFTWRRWRRGDETRLRRWAPILAGVALLAYTGTGDENTDIVAHLTGFASGVLLGVIYARVGDRLVPGTRLQLVLAAATLAVLAGSWLLAVSG